MSTPLVPFELGRRPTRALGDTATDEHTLKARRGGARYRVDPKTNAIVFFKTMPRRRGDTHWADGDDDGDEDDITVPSERGALAHADLLVFQCFGCVSKGVLEVKLAYRVPGSMQFMVLHVDADDGVRVERFEEWDFYPHEYEHVEIPLPKLAHDALHFFLEQQTRTQFNIWGQFFNYTGCCCLLRSGVDAEAVAPYRDVYHPDGYLPRAFTERRPWFNDELVSAALIHTGIIPSTHLDPARSTPAKIKRQLNTAFRRLEARSGADSMV